MRPSRPTERCRYFAYGSNMLTRRLRAADRAPSAEPVAVGYLQGRRLTFDKIGRDGSGKCDAERTGEPTHRVHGVVFDLAAHDRRALDRIEGVGSGYALEPVAVVTDGGLVEAVTYVAIRKHRGLRPFDWYKALAVAGAREHALPPGYIDALRAVESIQDPDVARRAAHEALLPAG